VNRMARIWTLLASLVSGCSPAPTPADESPGEPQSEANANAANAREEHLTSLRERMVERQIRARGVEDQRVLEAMRRVPRHRFVDPRDEEEAYADHPLSIGWKQTISQPYMVAVMSELAQVGPTERVLEIGTGSGYQAAVLAELAAEVYTIEIVEALGQEARALLEELGYDNVHTRIGDGYAGWPEQAPFDAIIVTAAPEEVPKPLIDQLKEGGRLVIPVGRALQELEVLSKHDGKIERETLFAVRFVPMTGEAGGD